jgi:hypothetical protein
LNTEAELFLLFTFPDTIQRLSSPYTPIILELNHNGALIIVYSAASCRSTLRILQPRPSSFLSSAIANRGEAKVEGIEALGRMRIAKFKNNEPELT